MKITLLALERSNHYIVTSPDDPKTFDLAMCVLSEVIKTPNSPYLLSSLASNIATYISKNPSQNSHVQYLLDSYHTALNNLLKKFGLNSTNDLSQEFINSYYDNLIADANFDENENDIEKKKSSYQSIMKLLNDRDLSLAAFTNDVQFIHYDLTSVLYTINPDLLEFYDEDKLKLLRNAVVDKWGYALLITQWQFALQRCNSIIQSFEDESSTTNSRSNSRSASLVNLHIHNQNLNHLHENELNIKQFSESESQAYWEVRWLVLFGMFLTGNYNLVVDNFNSLITTEKTIPGVMFNSIESLRSFNISVIDKRSILRVIILSIILSQNNEKRHEFWQNEIFIEAFYEDQVSKSLTESVDSINFPQFRTQLSEMQKQFPWFDYLDVTFERIKLFMFQKLLITYLSLVNRVSFDEISEAFHFSKVIFISFVIKMTNILDLPLFINEELEIIEFLENSDDCQNDLINKLHDQIHDEFINSKIKKLNSVIALANKHVE